MRKKERKLCMITLMKKKDLKKEVNKRKKESCDKLDDDEK